MFKTSGIQSSTGNSVRKQQPYCRRREQILSAATDILRKTGISVQQPRNMPIKPGFRKG